MRVPGAPGGRGASRRRLVRPFSPQGLLEGFTGDRGVPLEDSSAAVLETATWQSKSQDGPLQPTH